MVRQMKREKGITLIALTITIIILLILASITIYSGISTIKSSKLNKFKQELEIMQSQVNLLYEKYRTEIEEGQEIKIGEELTNSEEENNAFSEATESDKTGYRKFTKDTIEELGIEGIEREYLVNVTKRKVISLEPFEQNGEVYYTLEQLSEKNTIENGVDRGEIEFSIQTNSLEKGLEVIISDIKYSKYVGKGSILYQKVGDNTWKTLVTDFRDNEYRFTINEEGEYHIKIVDAAGVEKVTDTPIVVQSIGNYLLDETTYYDTLEETVAAAKDGSTIKVVKDLVETNDVTIDKNIILDTNGKTINVDLSVVFIHINDNVKLTIEGNGKIINNEVATLIRNLGELEINHVTIDGEGIGPSTPSTVIYNYNLLTINSGKILSSSSLSIYQDYFNTGMTILKGGIVNSIRLDGGKFQVDDGEVEVFNITNPVEVTINGGRINLLKLGSNSELTKMTIGDLNKSVNTNNPNIVELNTDELYVGATIIINFYNGAMHCTSTFLESIEKAGMNDIRSGYKVQTTYDNNTGLYELILIPE